jgi:hypothetical protein
MSSGEVIIKSARHSLSLASKALQPGVRTHATLTQSAIKPTILEATPAWRQFRAQHWATQHSNEVSQQVRALTLANMQARREPKWEPVHVLEEVVRIPESQGIDGLID